MLRRAALAAALVALAAPATAGAAPKATTKTVAAPVITSVRPLDVAVGEWLVIRGRHFVPGARRNTVVFKRDGARAVFAKAEYGTKKLIKIKVPTSVQEFLTPKAGEPGPTRFRVRVLARRFGKAFTAAKRSPVVSPPRVPGAEKPAESLPEGDCDGDGAKNSADGDDDDDGLLDVVERSLSLDTCVVDTDGDGQLDLWEFDCDMDRVLNRDETDDDDDLLSDALETSIGTNPCLLDTDGDTVEDGYEYQSARDLGDDEDQQPNSHLPYPGKKPYPNPLFADAEVDYDGDTLTLDEEFRLWAYTHSVTRTDARTLSPLSYSDGEQYSRSTRIESGPHAGRRVPTLAAASYDKHREFVAWASMAGYRVVSIGKAGPWWDTSNRVEFGLFDANHAGGETAAEEMSFDEDGDTFVSDNERDEDADGLSNYEEAHGRMLPSYWAGCYGSEKPFHIPYAGTSLVDADTDGDGVRDGADDQDHDDIPNLMELSRIAASGITTDIDGRHCKARTGLDPKLNHPGAYGRVNPFNPCLPYTFSRTCPTHFNEKTGAPYDDSPNWYALN